MNGNAKIREPGGGNPLLFWALVIAPVLMAAAFDVLLKVPIVEPDSKSYLSAAAFRTSVYPLFLKVAGGPALLSVQLLLFAAAVSWLIHYLYRLSGSLLLATCVCVGLLINPYVWQLQASVLSEALTTPLLVIMVGLLAGYVVNGRASIALASGLAAGLLAATRPSNLPLLLVPCFAVLISRDAHVASKMKLALLCLAVALVPVVADDLCSRAMHGPAATSLLGPQTYAKAVLVDAPPLQRSRLSPLEGRLAALTEVDFQPIRSTLEPLSNRTHVFDILQSNYEVCLEYGCTNEKVRKLGVPAPQLNTALFHVGLDRLEQNPRAYLRLTANEYRRLWLLHPRKDPAVAAEFNQFLKSAGPLPFQQQLGQESGPVPTSEQGRFSHYDRLSFVLLGFLVAALTIILGLIQLRRSERPYLTAAFIYLVAAQAVLLFCAMAGIGTPRYTMGMWPLLAAALAFVASAMVREVRRWLSR
jgi:hypothetical protein